MHRVVISMQNYVLGEAVEQALRRSGDFTVEVVERPEDAAAKCRTMAATALLMEVTGYSPYRLEERLKTRDEVKRLEPDCKVVLLVDENSEKSVADQIKQAKRDGVIDQFIYGSTSASFLVALMDTL